MLIMMTYVSADNDDDKENDNANDHLWCQWQQQ